MRGIQRVVIVAALVAIAGLLFSISRKLGSRDNTRVPPAAASKTPALAPAPETTAAQPPVVGPPPAFDQKGTPKARPGKGSGNGSTRGRKDRFADSSVADHTPPAPTVAAVPPGPRGPGGNSYTSQPNAAPVAAPLPAPSTPVPPQPPPPSGTIMAPDGTSFRVGPSDDPDDASRGHTDDAVHEQRGYPLGYAPSDVQAIPVPNQILRDERPLVQPSPDRTNAALAALGITGRQWTPIGPQPTTYTGTYTLPAPGYLTSGRVTALAVDPGNASIVYLGGSDGGVWKTTDGGATWTPLTDNQPSLSVGSIVLDPSNSATIYVGTGEEYGLFEFGSYYGAGVLKSTDGGARSQTA